MKPHRLKSVPLKPSAQAADHAQLRFCRGVHPLVELRGRQRSGLSADCSPVEYNLLKHNIEGGTQMAEPTYEELKARLEELEKKSVRRTGELDFKVGEKGGVSVYGLGRFPVTLYYEQWTRLLDAAPKLREFLEENKSRLKLKEK